MCPTRNGEGRTVEQTAAPRLERELVHVRGRGGDSVQAGSFQRGRADAAEKRGLADAGRRPGRGRLRDADKQSHYRHSSWGPRKTFTFPSTVATACQSAFMDGQSPVSVRLNEGLEVIGGGCFQYCELRRLALPSSVTSVGANAFYFCSQRELADLSAARCLKSPGSGAFSQCS